MPPRSPGEDDGFHELRDRIRTAAAVDAQAIGLLAAQADNVWPGGTTRRPRTRPARPSRPPTSRTRWPSRRTCSSSWTSMPRRWNSRLTPRTSPAAQCRRCSDRGWPRSSARCTHGRGDCSRSRRAFDTAAELLPDDPADPHLPYVLLSEIHLERWYGAAMAAVGDTAAIDRLRTALDGLDDTFTRARAGTPVDLAAALHTAGRTREVRTLHRPVGPPAGLLLGLASRRAGAGRA